MKTKTRLAIRTALGTAVAAASFAASTAQAAVYDLGTLTAGGSFANAAAMATPFTLPILSNANWVDVYNFTVSDSVASLSIFAKEVPSSISNFGIALVNGKNLSGNTWMAINGSQNTSFSKGLTFGAGSVAPGDYSFKVWGNLGASNVGQYEYKIAAAVPEPEQWAMFMAGLTVIGAIARRRSKGVDKT